MSNELVFGYDPEGNPRTIPVPVRGLIVWHSKIEYDRYFGPLPDEINKINLVQENIWDDICPACKGYEEQEHTNDSYCLESF